MNSTPAASGGPEPVPVEDKKSEKTDKRTPAQKILDLVEKLSVDLFHTPGSEPFARFWTTDHWENWPVRSQTFREWLSAMCYRNEGFVPSKQAHWEATSALAGRALYDSREERVHVRVAGHNGATYLDLCNKAWEAVRITKDGWDLVSQSPVKFMRKRGMQELPRPLDNGKIDELRPFLNLADEDDWKLVVGWLIGALRSEGPYPIFILEGTHGSAKSTASKLLRSLIDPNTAPLRSPPTNSRDLAIAAGNSWCPGFDNISTVKPWLSDALCRLSTGNGFSTRELWTDDSEKIFEGVRPVLLNGIDIGIDRADLLDRAILVSLAPISEQDRQTEANILVRFKAVQASILGGLLDAIVCALRRSPEMRPLKLPRMADFATWVCASEPALGWPEGSFLDAYYRNRVEANTLALEAQPLVGPLTRLAARGQWRGTATELRRELSDEQASGPAGEPELNYRTPRELSQALRRLVPSLHQLGITVEFARTHGSNSERIISIVSGSDGATLISRTGASKA